ncbi:hypothetical protein RTBOTA2_004547 [Rhodotorula toruloides]|uniref:Proteophosphoglycan ppg4 n=1 Tax=Rhodotorula toruloides TaxID=5286 RepID=A0A0K3C6T0_RHOTO|nr:hypothetical protein RTBOTA2_004547 [Rhodotorula toruloides]
MRSVVTFATPLFLALAATAQSLDTAAIAAEATSALAGIDTASAAAAATSFLGQASGGLADGISAVESFANGASVPTAVASFTSQYGSQIQGLVSSAIANPAGAASSAEALLNSAMGNADVSSFLAANPTLSALAGQATSLLGSGAGSTAGSGNAGSVESQDTNGAGGKWVGMGGAALLGGAVGAVMVLA